MEVVAFNTLKGQYLDDPEFGPFGTNVLQNNLLLIVIFIKDSFLKVH